MFCLRTAGQGYGSMAAQTTIILSSTSRAVFFQSRPRPWRLDRRVTEQLGCRKLGGSGNPFSTAGLWKKGLYCVFEVILIGTELFYEVRIPLPENYDTSLFESSINQHDEYTSKVRSETPRGGSRAGAGGGQGEAGPGGPTKSGRGTSHRGRGKSNQSGLAGTYLRTRRPWDLTRANVRVPL
jgi:hypothetical protein